MGAAESVKSGAGLIINVAVAVAVSDPPVPVMVMVNVPVVILLVLMVMVVEAVPLAGNVSGMGEKVVVLPPGVPAAVKEILAVKPLIEVAVTV